MQNPCSVFLKSGGAVPTMSGKPHDDSAAVKTECSLRCRATGRLHLRFHGACSLLLTEVSQTPSSSGRAIFEGSSSHASRVQWGKLDPVHRQLVAASKSIVADRPQVFGTSNATMELLLMRCVCFGKARPESVCPPVKSDGFKKFQVFLSQVLELRVFEAC